MIWDRVLGHEAQREMFRRALARGRLAHAYLFLGPPGIGKRLFARTLTACLFCERNSPSDLDACGECPACRQMSAGTHPDLLTVGLPEGKKELPIELIAGDRESRGKEGLCRDISLAPMSAPRRVALIDDAETMNEASANALLKTLEEPPAGSVMILLAPDESLLLPTIRSRCQPVRFAPLSAASVTRILGPAAADVPDLSRVLEMAGGSPDVARQLLQPELGKLWRTVEETLAGSQIRPNDAIRQVTAALEELGSETAAQREHMQWALDFAVESLRRRLAREENLQQLDRLGLLLDRCFEAQLHLRQTMPVPLCLEALYTELGRRSRAAV